MKLDLVIVPRPCPRIDWRESTYRVSIDTDPRHPELDFPISLVLDTGGDDNPIEFEPDDAIEVGKALIRAAKLRQRAMKAAASTPQPQKGGTP